MSDRLEPGRLDVGRLNVGQLKLGRLPLGRLALGCAPIGNLYRATSDLEVLGVVGAAIERGVVLFDVAPLYGHGMAETRLGRALHDLGVPRDRYLLSTKVGRLLRRTEEAPESIFVDIPAVEPVWDFTRDGVLRSVEESLARLGTDRVDMLHVHDPDDHIEAARRGAFRALIELRNEGVVRAVGLGTNHPSVADRFLGQVDLDVLLLAGRWTLLDRSGAGVLARCEQLGVAVLAAGVFNSGILAAPGPGAPFDYGPAPDAVLGQVARLEAICARYGVPLAAAAVQFPLRHPAVGTVLVGARTREELESDVALLDHPIPAELWEELVSCG